MARSYRAEALLLAMDTRPVMPEPAEPEVNRPERRAYSPGWVALHQDATCDSAVLPRILYSTHAWEKDHLQLEVSR